VAYKQEGGEVGGSEDPLSVEWEDNAMDREFGAPYSLEYIRQMNFWPSRVAFDKELEKEKK
jgi:hypothetical protein